MGSHRLAGPCVPNNKSKRQVFASLGCIPGDFNLCVSSCTYPNISRIVHLSPSLYMKIFFVCILVFASPCHLLTRHWQARTRKRRSKNCKAPKIPFNSPSLRAHTIKGQSSHPQQMHASDKLCLKMHSLISHIITCSTCRTHSYPSHICLYLIATTPLNF